MKKSKLVPLELNLDDPTVKKFLTNYNLLKYVCEETLADKISLNGEAIFDVSCTLENFNTKPLKSNDLNNTPLT